LNSAYESGNKGLPSGSRRLFWWLLIAVLIGIPFAAWAIRRKPESPAVSRVNPNSAPAPFLPTVTNSNTAPNFAPAEMVWIPGGEFSMGSTVESESLCGLPGVTSDALPVHRVYVDGFWMDTKELTNEEFEKFVNATAYVTIAERVPASAEFPEAPPENLVPGSTVFTPSKAAVPLDHYLQWWRYRPGANWRHPEGPRSSIKGKEKFPVVQIAYDDALAYATWAGKRLPTEAEWEFAARGGLTGMLYAWGNDFRVNDKPMANTYQGKFPVKDTGADGFAALAPVGSFAPNGFGLYDVAGNAWEWVSDWYSGQYYSELAQSGNVARNPHGPGASFDREEPGVKKRVQRGGSFLCTDEYCSRYLVGTRGKGEANTAGNHLGVRLVMDPK
jgi:formylglycine-generating enzyme